MRRANCFLVACGLLLTIALRAQTTFPVNGVADERSGHYAFTNATIVKDATTTLTNATMVIKNGKIVAVGADVKVPQGAVAIDCKGKYIYPSFIDIFTDYGTPAQQPRQGGFNFFAPQQITSATKGAYGWNQAIKSEVDA
ncbi:MAG TPA: amidohydrolase, partial [Flavisolibacter sp.]|nr:amidohydrolase [Flavisolibacter sp.]